MDPGRFALQQGWDSNSTLEGYDTVHDQDFSASGSYGGRRYPHEGFLGDHAYARGAFHRDVLERDMYPPPPTAGSMWGEPRRRSYDDEYGPIREPRRQGKPYLGSFHEMDRYHGIDSIQDRHNYRDLDSYHDSDNYHDYGYDRHARPGSRDRDGFSNDSYEHRSRNSHHNRQDSHERDYDFGRYSYDSDHERSRRDSTWRRRESRDRDRDKRAFSRERDTSPCRWRGRSRSRGRDDRSRSRSPRGRSHGRSHREDSYDSHYERSEKRRDRERDEKRHADFSVAPSATVVVKGLSQKTTEEDLYQILAEWGPLRHVRVIKERNSGVSRGFAFIDFPTVDAACNMMDKVGDDGLVVDGRKLFFEYSSKPTGGAGAPSVGHESGFRPGCGRNIAPPSDWMCVICGCVNFARRTSCFQCNEPRTEDAPPADIGSSNSMSLGKKGSEAGPTHVLVVRGLDENADEEMLRYEFSKHAPIRDLRLVRDKFTHVSRGFAFVHFHSDATKALEATNGTTLEKNGQILRVAYAKSIHGPGAGGPQSSSLAAAAIEAATFAQQYDAAGWAPKEYNPDEKQNTATDNQSGNSESQKGGTAPQSGFVWDEKSGYYYDAASGFYYDGNSGLYYDGNTGIWYSYDHQNQQYVPCTDQNASKATGESMTNENSKASEAASNRKVVISAPATIAKPSEKASLPDAVQAAAAAALAAEKKEKEKSKEIKLASKSNLLANKKKMNNVLAMWKQRNHEGQAARVVLDDNQANSVGDKQNSTSIISAKSKLRPEKETLSSSSFAAASRVGNNISSTSLVTQTLNTDSQSTPKPASSISGGTLKGVIRGSGRGVNKADTVYSGSSNVDSDGPPASDTASTISMSMITNSQSIAARFKTDASALGSYSIPVAAASGKRRFSEAPVQSTTHREQPQTTYRDRAAERRSLYGSSSSSFANELSDFGDSNRDYQYQRGSSSDVGSMPFPPGVGGGRTVAEGESYEVITADRALDESNVGNRMLEAWAGKKDWVLARMAVESRNLSKQK